MIRISLNNDVLPVLLIALIGWSSCSSPSLKLTDLDLTDLQGNPVKLSDYNSDAIFVNFWATWCKPCLQEFPSIVRAQEMMQPKGFQFLFISDEPVSVIESFKQKKDYEFVYLKSNKAIAEYSIYSLPVTYIIVDGKVSGAVRGGYRWDTPGNLKLLEGFLK